MRTLHLFRQDEPIVLPGTVGISLAAGVGFAVAEVGHTAAVAVAPAQQISRCYFAFAAAAVAVRRTAVERRTAAVGHTAAVGRTAALPVLHLDHNPIVAAHLVGRPVALAGPTQTGLETAVVAVEPEAQQAHYTRMEPLAPPEQEEPPAEKRYLRSNAPP